MSCSADTSWSGCGITMPLWSATAWPPPSTCTSSAMGWSTRPAQQSWTSGICDTEHLGLSSEYKVGVDFERDKIYIYVVNILVVQVDYSLW